MRANADPRSARSAAPALDAGERTIRNIYLACLAISFGLFLALAKPGHGAAFWIVAALAAIGIVLAFVAPSIDRMQGRLEAVLPASIALAFLLVGLDLLLPGPATSAVPLSERVAQATIWPHVLVGLFGSRVMAEDNEIRTARYWTEPTAVRNPPHAQSTLSAIGLALALTLAFWWMLPRVASAGDGAATRVLLSALRGETLIHHGIIFLFFVIIGFVADGLWLHWQDRAGVDNLRRMVPRPGAADPRGADALALAEETMSAATQSRILPPVEDIASLAGRPIALTGGSIRAASAFRHASASRRYIRSLLPLLPMLGFLGTVIGLSVAIGELPTGLGQQAGQPVDIAGSLGGLALKFETTLLGLTASMIAALALSALERAETELHARCALLLDSIDEAPDRAA